MLDHMAEVDEPLCFHIVQSAPAANSIQIRLSVAEGKAPCHQPFTRKPAAPIRFIHWNRADWPVSLPSVTRI